MNIRPNPDETRKEYEAVSILDTMRIGVARTMAYEGQKPTTFSEAYAKARPVAAAGDPAGAIEVLCSLLWNVEASEGGFIGLTDEELRTYCDADKRLDYDLATKAQWAPIKEADHG